MDNQNNINCHSEMNKYLMSENVAYRLRLPISVLLAIIVSVFMKKAHSLDNFLIAHIIIPIGTFLFVWFIIDVCVRNTVSKDKLRNLEDRCNHMLNPAQELRPQEVEHLEMKAPVPSKEKIKDDESDVDVQEKVHNVGAYISVDSHHLKPTTDETPHHPEIAVPVNSTDEDKYGHENTNYLNKNKKQYTTEDAPEEECQMGSDKCFPLCSGSDVNNCNVVAPIPGPQWQVQKASTVQNRLSHGVFSEATCPIK